MEKRDSEKGSEDVVRSPVGPPLQVEGGGPGAASSNPLYCSYVDGQFTYKDPSTQAVYVWNEGEKKWVSKVESVDSNKLEVEGGGERGGDGGGQVLQSPGGSHVQFDGENYTYTDQDGTVFLWDSGKGAWFPKEGCSPPDGSSSFPLPPSPPDLSSCTASNQTLGFFNPNYATALTSPGGGGEEQPQDSASATSSTASRRFYYASLSPTSMGVNEQPGLFLSPDDQVNNNDQVGEDPQQQAVQRSEVESTALPPGWERHDDTNGAYYWHIKSGTIQRERPSVHSPVTCNNPALMIPGSLDGISGFVRRSTTMGAVSSAANSSNNTGNTTASSNAEKRRSWVNYLEDENNTRASNGMIMRVVSNIPAYEVDKHALKFAAVSLGCLCICEEDLTPERSSRAVSKVIAELTGPSSGSAGGGAFGGKDKSGTELASRMWAHTDISPNSRSQMYLELSDSHLRVKVHREGVSSLTVLEQPIHSIRVWGVGREDPRDFAFVAREKQTRQFLCHVFRLEMYARPLASSLRDACKKIMIERNARIGGGGGGNNKRPTSLGLKKNCNDGGKMGGERGGVVPGGVGGGLFPTPMDEPRKVIKAFYLGSKGVVKPTGMDVLNSAIESLKHGGCDRVPVLVSVAPSVISITSTDCNNKQQHQVHVEVRVRFLSFMGIGSDIRTCGIIIHTSRDDFEAHCFYSTPSTGALCKAIEAACVLRYQKCLDAHNVHSNSGGGEKQNRGGVDGGGGGPQSVSSGGPGSQATSPKSASVIASATASNLASALKTVFSNFGKAKSEEK